MKKNILLVVVVLVIVLAALALVFYKPQSGLKKGNVTTTTSGDQSLNDVIKSGKLVVATFPELSPMTFKDASGKNIGYDIDLVNEIAKRMGVTAEYKSEAAFQDLFPLIRENKDTIDIAVSSITITPERSKTMLFSNPYFTSGQSIILKRSNTDINSEKDLKDKKVSAMANTTCVEATRPLLTDPATQLVMPPTFNEELDLLRAGKVDAVIHDYAIAAYIAATDQNFKIVGDPFTQEYYGMMTNPANKTLMERINKILSEMKVDGKIKEIDKKWFGR